jgi:hypothetical protein
MPPPTNAEVVAALTSTLATRAEARTQFQADLAALQSKKISSGGARLPGDEVDQRTGYTNAARELDLTHDAQQYMTKLQAMTDPQGYALKKMTAFSEMQEEVQTAFKDSYTKFYDAGLSQRKAKENAMRVAEKHKEILMQIHEESYPSGANMIEKKMVKKQSKLIGLDD